MSAPATISRKQHLLTIQLEDYFHVGTFDIQCENWYRFEARFEQNTLKVLDLLDRFNVKATFFVFGWIADQRPEIIREVVNRGHEIACSSYYRRSIRQMMPAEFSEDLARSREAVEQASGTKVLGYRTAGRWSTKAELWALDILAEQGFIYDSSIAPIFSSSRLDPKWRFAHQHQCGEKHLWEIPVSTCSMLGWRVPIAGGNYLRQLPHALGKRAVEHWHQTYDAPLVMYFHTWELDPDQPRINAVSRLDKIRHYRRLDRMLWILEDYFETYSFVAIAQYLGLNNACDVVPQSSIEPAFKTSLQTVAQTDLYKQPPPTVATYLRPARQTQISIVVPCFNEQLALPYLSNTLKSVVTALESQYVLHFIFVDDGSCDETWNTLQQTFGSWRNCRFVQHERNRGVAAAIMTGIGQAQTEIVCSIDCDCTYDPHELPQMIPKLTAGVDMVTASPYHPQGSVRNVPGWRLALSKTASLLYRQVLNQKLCTYTSCFRVYRRSAVVNLHLRESGFLGIAEMLGKLDINGSNIVEHPAMLEVRLFGQSKMKIIRTIICHLRLLTRLSRMRLRRGRAFGKALDQELSSNKAVEVEYNSLSITGEKQI